MAYHVYIERTQDPSPTGQAQLAAAMSARYKLPVAQVTQHLAAGRFRVKSGVDEATARKFAEELVAMGAVCSIVDATTGVALVGGAPPAAAARAAPPPIPAAPSSQYESGLAAAFSPGAGAAPLSLGALDGIAANAPGLSLASLDGSDEQPMEAASLSVAEPPRAAPLALDVDDDEIGSKPKPTNTPGTPPPRPAPAPAPASGKGAGPKADLFAAPDLTEVPLELGPSPAKPRSANTPLPSALPQPPAASKFAPPAPLDAPMEIETRRGPVTEPQRARMAQTGSGGGILLAEGADPKAPPLLTEREAAEAERPAAQAAPRGGPLAHHFYRKPRHRILAGLGFALLLGYLPAHLYAGAAEDSRFGEIRQRLETQQRDITSHESWSQLDAPGGARDQALQDMKRARSRTRLVTLVLWLAAGSGLGWVWFRKLT